MANELESNNNRSPLRWLPLAAFAVTVLGLIWAVLSHFIPQSEPTRPPRADAFATPADVKVEMHGNHNTGIGLIQGSEVTIGNPKAEEPSPVERTQ